MLAGCMAAAESGPLVSIVTPSYNQGAFLEEAIQSVLDQDYSPIEYIVVDGGSTDRSVEVIRRHGDRIAWWTSERDRGQVDALARGFARATGEILGWLNSDDALLPGAVSAGVEALERDPEALLVYGENVLIDEHSRTIGRLPARPFDLREMVRTCQNHVAQPGSLFRRRALELAGPLREDSYYYFDFEFVLGVALVGRAVALPRVLAAYRLHPESKSVVAALQKAVDHLRLYDAFFSRPDLPAEVREVEAEARSRSDLAAGEYFYEALELKRARRHLLRGLRLYPRHVSGRMVSLLVKSLLPEPLVRVLRARRRGG